MTSPLRKLPIGLQDFAGLRKNGYLYVDKTAFVYKLATEGKQYFLGRPRRFGKSLLLSTIKYYFQGKKELFENLAIHKLEKDWTEYPVFHIDLNIGNFSTLELLDQRLDIILSRMEEEWGVERNSAIAPSSRLETLIIQAYNRTGKGVVVLFDEYDKPLLRTMNDADLNEKIRAVLRDFYSVMKSADAYLQFVLYTGVTKFSKISVFSDLNQPEDISMADKYAEICGITESELIHNFEPEIQSLAIRQKTTYENILAELKRKYDGYHFSEQGAGMYNPFSLLNTFSQLTLKNYWYKTGTPTFLVEMIAAGDLDIRDFSGNVTIETPEMDDYHSAIPILYQSGYLTIKDFNQEDDSYILGFPNEEVKYGFLRDLLPTYLPVEDLNPLDFSALKFAKDLREGDVDAFMTRLKARFASIPYSLTDRTERSYQLGFYLIFELMGQYVQTEVQSAKGRADAVVKTGDTIYVFEFKMSQNATAEDALKQINDKGYLIPYIAGNRKLVKIGVEFSEEERGISRWAVE